MKIAPPNTLPSLETSWWQAHSNEFVSQSARRSYQIFSLAAIKKKEFVLPFDVKIQWQAAMNWCYAGARSTTTATTHSYHVNILTCRIKAMRKLVTKHVTNGAITQRPEIKEHVIHKNSRNAACLRGRGLELVESKDGWLNKSPFSGSEQIRNGLEFFEERLRNSREDIPEQQKLLTEKRAREPREKRSNKSFLYYLGVVFWCKKKKRFLHNLAIAHQKKLIHNLKVRIE